MTLDHYGAYVAQFDVSWDEFTFDQNGKEVLTHKTWEGSGKRQNSSLFYSNPSSTKFKKYKNRRKCTGLAWEWWRTIINEQNVPLTNEIKVSIGGTTLYPTASISH